MPSCETLPQTLELVPVSPLALDNAAERLRSGRMVAIPTETVYGLAARADVAGAVEQIYAAKGRPTHNPLISHYNFVENVEQDVKMPAVAHELAAAFWPGPLTMILNLSEKTRICEMARAGLPSAAVRVPDHPIALELLKKLDFPVAAPSANRSGRVSPTLAEHVRQEFFDKDLMVLDGGACRVGVESTIVDVRAGGCSLLRPGGVTVDELMHVCGSVMLPDATGCATVVLAPGMLASHYAPRTPLRLDIADPLPNEALVAFGPDVPTGFARVINLSERGDLSEAAHRLYDVLHQLDDGGFARLAVMPIPPHGLGLALNDRLRRASAER